MEATTENETPSLPNHAIRFGTILGGIAIALTVIAYVVDPTFMVTFKFIGLSFALGIGIVIYAGINYRTEIGGYLSYGQAFTHGFIVLAVSGLINALFGILLFTVIDPDLSQKMMEAIITNTEDMMAGFGAPQSSIDQTIDGLRTELPGQFTMVGQVITFGKGLIAYAVIALITSLFTRKNIPLEM
ncbi:MAG: DUF4199 domain-containing protein [Cytophagales bacterium]|nr:DUF4199 domain-containing protein [Cytophagales bacterium]